MPSILKKGRDFLEMPGRAIREGTHWVLGTQQEQMCCSRPCWPERQGENPRKGCAVGKRVKV